MSRGRNRMRGASKASSGAPLDADAQAYIAATGELFPEALNALVLGIKAAGLWDNHIGSIKKAIGVPSLAASLIDLRNTAFNGTAVNAPGHSATQGWTFLNASSQYIADPWGPLVSGSKGSLNSVHFGRRIKDAIASNESATRNPGSALTGTGQLGFSFFEPGFQAIEVHGAQIIAAVSPAFLGHWIGTRTASNASALYQGGVSRGTSFSAANFAPSDGMPIGAKLSGGTPEFFFTGRITIQHGGAGLDASQAAALTALFDSYATAAGET